MKQLLAFYNPGKDKTKVRYGRSAFQEPVSIERMLDWYFELPVTEWQTNSLKFSLER